VLIVSSYGKELRLHALCWRCSWEAGQLILARFSGYGTPLICLASEGIARILKGEKFEYVEIPKLFKPSLERLIS
jgi:hypothetical protein